ncbi:hypothetical protein ACF1GY_35615 [Streptomyces sp. NPDC014684]|uniref:hypothetical protein n=1 Tax=Streptomyces sp. NPDC014684 TaxID=3364880 RepID=UPI0036F8B979
MSSRRSQRIRRRRKPCSHPEGRLVRIRRRFTEWRIHQHVARGMAHGVGSGGVSVLVFWVQARY